MNIKQKITEIETEIQYYRMSITLAQKKLKFLQDLEKPKENLSTKGLHDKYGMN